MTFAEVRARGAAKKDMAALLELTILLKLCRSRCAMGMAVKLMIDGWILTLTLSTFYVLVGLKLYR